MDILLTLDYELFNGVKSGSVKNSLITPTYELLKILDKYNFKATFFVDTVFLNRLCQLKSNYAELEADWDDILTQLRYLSKEGHDIQLHIHPNWFNATFSDGHWTSVMDEYKLSDMSPAIAEKMFIDGISLLEKITGRKVVAFRAGAYCIQTYPDYGSIFGKYGIAIDSSVNRSKYSHTEKWEYYDYRKIPQDYIYTFLSDVCRKDINGIYTEVSIPNYRISKASYYWNKFKLRNCPISMKPWGDGKGSVGGKLYKGMKRLWVYVLNHIRSLYIPASIDSLNPIFLKKIYNKEKKSCHYMLIMGHPKCLSPLSLHLFDDFLKSIDGKYSNKIISQIH